MASLPILGGIALLIGLIILALKFAQKSSSTSTTTSSSSTLTKKANKPLNRKVTLN
eukprot:CAMPEP_0113398600 /NCGR_PEP_ID=MMETSP0013_2-20120614/15056_1 /TAXON_ID=2843 ORGANISM="Skeletonema costatum, Strain 1716" /NCGR_SAMPLE_ID=MMETSP0013_2 /ASSEMBLY_ACC=CAM_ASM_000158 /LENGTH=55 /DNA_ID=CAMNT_0000283373 /DNA_START=47 /DNA_END=211 /DNA_ORIENTATION=- /assembly_acc=CAM_ASM_000158